MPLDGDREFGDALQLGVVENPGVGLLGPERNVVVVAVDAADDLEVLVADTNIQDVMRLFVDHVGVGLDLAGHDDLAKTERRLDDDAVTRSVFGSAVNATPDCSELIICCTTTAIAGSAVNLRLAR